MAKTRFLRRCSNGITGLLAKRPGFCTDVLDQTDGAVVKGLLTRGRGGFPSMG